MNKLTIVLLAAIILTTGCVGQLQAGATADGIISLHVDDLPLGADLSYANAVKDAQSFWESRQNITFVQVAAQSDAEVLVKWVKEFGGRTLGHTVQSNLVEIGVGDSLCLGKWRPYKYDTVVHIASHELGHVLGHADDYNNTNSIMYYLVVTSYETDVDEKDVLPDSWTRFYPVCTKQNASAYSFEATSTEPLDINVVESREDYQKLIDRKAFSHYPDCQASGVKSYRKTCVVKQGAGIVLSNPGERRLLGGAGASAEFMVVIKEV